jgi:hypothetical protein
MWSSEAVGAGISVVVNMINKSNKKYDLPYHVLLAACLLLGALPCVSHAADSQVQARLDSSRARIGDRLTLTVTAHSAAGETVQFPDLKSHLDKFELLDELPAERVAEEGGAALTRRSWVITAFETGRLEVSSLPFAVMQADGSVDTLWTEPQLVEVASLVQDTLNAQIRPLRGLVDVPRLWKQIALWSAVGLFILIALILLWRKYLRQRAEKLAGNMPVAPARPSHLVALEELDRIKSMGLIEKGELKRFHILVSEAVRRYLEGRYGILAPEMTTWELAAAFSFRNDIDPAIKELTRGFLEDCDLVKFAKYVPQIVEINATFNRAYEIVEKTRLLPPVSAADDSETENDNQQIAAVGESAGEG